MNKSTPYNHSIKQFLKNVDVNHLLDKIDEFKKMDIRDISDKKLFDSISNILTFTTDSGNKFEMPVLMGNYAKGTKFYRVRVLDPNDTTIPLKGMKVEQDAWNPPPEYIKVRNRLNNVNESLLYTSPINPLVAIRETKIKMGEHFALIVYKAKETIKVSRIGEFNSIEGLTADENFKLRLLINFLRDEFTRDVGAGTEFLYRVSERIAKDYFDLPPRVIQDGWCYPSVAKKGSFNVCFRPEIAREVLELQGVILCKQKFPQFECKSVCSLNGNGLFEYFPIGSEVQKSLFPEIK